MKLHKRQKSLADVKSNAKTHRDMARQGYVERPRRSQASIDAEIRAMMERREREQEERQKAATTSPLTAHAAGVGYQGPNMPDKGKKNGSCNVTACQMPLAGRPQFYMKEMGTTRGRLYYCSSCERKMTEWDEVMVRRGEQVPNGWSGALNQYGYRCWPDEDNANVA